MDPKSAPTLDPKLKEAYDRVMGATLPKAPPPPPTPAHPTEAEKPMMPSPTPTAAVEQHAPTPMVAATPAASTPLAHASSGFVASHEEKKPAVSGTLLIVAGVVFFIVYTLFCLKLFGVAIPFLG